MDKLGVKKGTKIHWIGCRDDEFAREVIERGAVTVSKSPDLTFLRAESKKDLERIQAHGECPIWVVYPKGVTAIRESDVRNAGRNVSLIDVKVASFSGTHTALKFVRKKS
jgi:hypothetical protein